MAITSAPSEAADPLPMYMELLPVVWLLPAAVPTYTLCPPVDTSPPFTPTEDGLETTSSFPNLKIDSGDVKFDALTVTSSITIDDYTAGDTSSKYLDLDANGVGYKILCV